MKHWVFLAVAIVAEVMATAALTSSEGFTRRWPSPLTVLGYAAGRLIQTAFDNFRNIVFERVGQDATREMLRFFLAHARG